MKLLKISTFLNNAFNVSDYSPDIPFSNLIPQGYGNTDLIDNFEPNFLNNFNGLMVKNSNNIEKIYTSVFLSKEVIDEIINHGQGNALLIVHHPMEDQTSDKGFLSLPKNYLQKLKDKKISVYSLHNPLDQDIEMSTSKSIARKLNLKNEEIFSNGEGILGSLENPYYFDEFIELLKNVFGIKKLCFEKKIDKVYKIAIVAGGGTDIDLIRNISKLSPDTYLTGEYVSRIKNSYAEKERTSFRIMNAKISFNLIACSHYGTEKIVMQNELEKFLQQLEIKTEFIEQSDPWY